MNVTALSAYLNCPLEFYYKNLIRIPQAKMRLLSLGAAHYALEKLFKKMQDSSRKNSLPKQK